MARPIFSVGPRPRLVFIPNGFTRDRRQPRRLLIPGVQYMPHPSVVLKLDYRNIDNWEGSSNDEVSLGFGLVF